MDCYEVMQRGRNFRLLDEEEQPQLLDFLTTYLPESLKFHQTLLTYMRDRVWDFYFYVANGWPDSEPLCLHFPGMTLSPHGMLYESIGIFCPNDQLELLRLVRDEDMLIDWSRPLYINFVHIEIANELVRLYKGKGTVDSLVVDVWMCEKDECQIERADEEYDADVQVLPLKAEHAEGIHELYPANDIECHELFLRLIRTLPAAGVFCKDRLAAWMVQSYYGAMFSMQTKPEYRRKGYGTKLARYLAKRVADRGYHPFVVIRPDNEASQSLYKKLGFKRLYQTVRMVFTPATWQETSDEVKCIFADSDNLRNTVTQFPDERIATTTTTTIEEDDDDDDEAIECEDTLTGYECNEEATEIIVDEAEDNDDGEENCIIEDDELRPNEMNVEVEIEKIRIIEEEEEEEEEGESKKSEHEEIREEINENTEERNEGKNEIVRDDWNAEQQQEDQIVDEDTKHQEQQQQNYAEDSNGEAGEDGGGQTDADSGNGD